MISGNQLVDTARRLGISHFIWLPDAFTGRWEEALSSAAGMSLVRICREGEAWTLAAGLWLGGKRPLVIMQNTGLFESGDALRNVLFELAVPLYALIGYRNYLVPNSPDTAKAFTEPVLRAWGLDYSLLTGDAPLARFEQHYRECAAAGRPGVGLVPEGRG